MAANIHLAHSQMRFDRPGMSAICRHLRGPGALWGACLNQAILGGYEWLARPQFVPCYLASGPCTVPPFRSDETGRFRGPSTTSWASSVAHWLPFAYLTPAAVRRRRWMVLCARPGFLVPPGAVMSGGWLGE